MPAQRQRKELTDFQKGQIDTCRRFIPPAKVGPELGIPRQTVASFLDRYDECGFIANLPRSGRPRKTTAATDRFIARTAESETRVPMREISNIVNADVSERTLHRRLLEAGIRKWKAVRRPLLNEKHAAQRLKWAQEHQHKTREDWSKVAWSDECAVQKDSDPRQLWVFRRQSKREKYDIKNVRPKSRDGRVSQMIWGCFVGDKLGPIALIEGNVNQYVYMDILADKLVPFINALKTEGIKDVVFQQDNARSHTAKKTKHWLADAGRQHGFKVMEWPPNSPDMNLIESLWAHLKLALHQRYPDTLTLEGSPNAIKTILKDRVMKIWWDIGEEVLNRLIDSMPGRVHALLNAKGWYTDY